MADEGALASTLAPTVLVVDDEKNIRRTLEMVLSGEGYRVLEADSAEQALETLSNPDQPVDVAIFDLKLPGMSGLQALEKLRADDATRDCASAPPNAASAMPKAAEMATQLVPPPAASACANADGVTRNNNPNTAIRYRLFLMHSSL